MAGTESVISDRSRVVRAFLKGLEGEFEVLVKDFGDIISSFSMAHWIVLMAVWENSGSITQTSAKKMIEKLPKFQSDKARRSLIKELSSSGLISKTVDPRDERKIILHVTEEARPRIDKYMDQVAGLIDSYARELQRG